jgi:hypothetical protein
VFGQYGEAPEARTVINEVYSENKVHSPARHHSAALSPVRFPPAEDRRISELPFGGQARLVRSPIRILHTESRPAGIFSKAAS